MGRKARQRGRKGTGSVVERDGRSRGQIDLGVGPDGNRQRRSKTFDSREQAEQWLLGVARLCGRADWRGHGPATGALLALVDRARGAQGQARPGSAGRVHRPRLPQQHRDPHHP